jgi:hypothetical protein
LEVASAVEEATASCCDDVRRGQQWRAPVFQAFERMAETIRSPNRDLLID